MNNILLDPLPEEWHGYTINTWFQVGVQVYITQYDGELSDLEKADRLLGLLFEDEYGYIRRHPSDKDELEECVNWFLNGWCHDNAPSKAEKRRLVDYDVDQWRIYADFRQIYGINLNEADLHWWEFCGMLWNMPHERSSFMQVLEIRRKKITSKMGKEEKAAITEAKKIYALEQTAGKKEYSSDECRKIDDYDRMMAEAKANKAAQEAVEREALAEFRRH